jgi:uncharacterized protein with GYD domain
MTRGPDTEHRAGDAPIGFASILHPASCILHPFLKEEVMATYILLSTLTDEGRRTLRERPERIKEVNREVEALGAKVIGQYAVLGPYDFVNILEAPDNETVARISVELGARGTVQIMSLPAIPVDAFINGLKKKAPARRRKSARR